MPRGTTGVSNPPLSVAAKTKGKPKPALPASVNPQSRTRKPASPHKAALNTSLSAHPRTDPLNALTVLMKLIASLPVRTGGTAYKLTPVEHALVVHLVGVLDPYVYAGARALGPRMDVGVGLGLLDLPTELLDGVLGHVESREDVGRVGLVCKRLAGVVFPRHFEYRVVRAKASALGVWHHLSVHRALAGNVRSLEVMDERPSASGYLSTALVPRGILPGEKDTDLESTDDGLAQHTKHARFLLRALPHLSGLRSFRWAAMHSPIGINQVWDVLVRRGGLREIEVWDNTVFGPRDEDEDEDVEDEASALLAMERVAFRATPHAYGASKTPQLTRIAAMLHQCVNLTDLEISYTFPRARPTAGAGPLAGSSIRLKPLADELLTFGRWAGLTRVTLVNLRLGSAELLVQFLMAHEQLEAVKVEMTTGGGPLVFPYGALPRLRELHAPNTLICALLEAPSADRARRPLDSIGGVSLGSGSSSGASSTDAHIISLLHEHSTVTRLSLAGWSDMDDIRRLAAAVPGVRELTIGPRRIANGGANARDKASSSGGGPVSNTHEWMEILATLPALTTLHGVKFFYDVGGDAADALGAGCVPAASSSTGAVVQGAAGAAQKNLSAMARSRLRKNDEIAGLLAWRCPKLRRVDHWEGVSGAKEIVLLRDGAGGRWEVRKSKA